VHFDVVKRRRLPSVVNGERQLVTDFSLCSHLTAVITAALLSTAVVSEIQTDELTAEDIKSKFGFDVSSILEDGQKVPLKM